MTLSGDTRAHLDPGTTALERRLGALAYFQRTPLPDLGSDYIVLDFSDAQHLPQLHELGITAHGGGRRNRLYLHRRAGRVPEPSRFTFHGDDNVVIIGAACGFRGLLTFEGSGNLVVLCGGQSRLALDATLYAGDALVCGSGAFAWGIRVWVQGGTVCTIDDDCLLSENITIRTTDHHAMIDLETWTQINKPADVTIGRHVWVCPNCIIGKGTTLGDGAILAPGTVISSAVPRAELWGGSPARMLRRNVSWVASHPASEADIAALRALLG